MKKEWLVVCILLMAGTGCERECEREEVAEINEESAFESAEFALEDLSPEDIGALSEGAAIFLSASPLSPLSLTSVSDGKVISILNHLNPNRIFKGCRVPFLPVIDAPFHLGKYLSIKLKEGDLSCAEVKQEGTCPVSGAGDRCVTTFVMEDGCSVEVPFPGGLTDVLTFTGVLTQSITIKEFNSIDVLESSVNLKISSANTGAYLLYNGDISARITVEGEWLTPSAHITSISIPDLSVEDSSGGVVTVSGTRTVKTVYGESVTVENKGTLTYTPFDGDTKVIKIDMKKEVVVDGEVKRLIISDSITTDGTLRTRDAELTIAVVENEGNVVKEIVIDGEEVITGPRGTFYVTVDNVVLDLNCLRNPCGGSVIITNGEMQIEIVFKDSCSCDATLILPDGSTKEINSCNLRRSLCR